jgi:hypothetical protein
MVRLSCPRVGVGCDRRRIDSQLAQLGRELFGPALLNVGTLPFLFGLVTLFLGFATFFLSSEVFLDRAFLADWQQIALGVIPPEPGCCLVVKEPMPDAEVDSHRLDPEVPSFVGRHPAISALLKPVNLELARVYHEYRVMRSLDGLFVDPELSFVRGAVALFCSIFRRVFDQDRWLDVLLPEDVRATIAPIQIRWNAGNVKPVGADRAPFRGLASFQ